MVYILVVVRHAHMEGDNLDLTHEMKEIHKILNISVTMELSSPRVYVLHQHQL